MADAAFLRMARFRLSNEFHDWDTVHNTLTAANALHQGAEKDAHAGVAAGRVDVAMSIYLDRFLKIADPTHP